MMGDRSGSCEVNREISIINFFRRARRGKVWRAPRTVPVPGTVWGLTRRIINGVHFLEIMQLF